MQRARPVAIRLSFSTRSFIRNSRFPKVRSAASRYHRGDRADVGLDVQACDVLAYTVETGSSLNTNSALMTTAKREGDNGRVNDAVARLAARVITSFVCCADA
jgi:hypothetical protein